MFFEQYDAHGASRCIRQEGSLKDRRRGSMLTAASVPQDTLHA